MDTFADYPFEPCQFIDQSIQSAYANGPQHPESIRPSDLDVSIFNDFHSFGTSQSAEMPLQIDPSLMETRGARGQQTPAQTLTPPTSLSPEQRDAVGPKPSSLTGAAAQAKSNSHKRKPKSVEIHDEDVDAERRLKNRVAASKCRVKKKGREQVLIQASEQKAHENLELRSEYRRLTQEALWYKNQLILHGNCGDAHIDRWLTNSAAKIVHTFGEGSAFQPNALSNPATPSSAELVYERRHSGISTNSKASSGSSPAPRHSSVKVGLGSPIDEASYQDARIPPTQLKSEPDDALMSREPVMRARSFDHSNLGALANATANRATSVPLQHADVLKRSDPGYIDGLHQKPTVKEVSSVSQSALVSAAPPSMADGTPVVPWDVQLPATAMTIDPRLRGDDMPLESPNADEEYFAVPVQQDEHSHDELMQIPETEWMEV